MAARSKKIPAPRRATTARPARLRIGFVDLIDAAPLIVAHEHGLFADEGLQVELERQLGWGNIRDRLTFGQLDAAHSLLGMPLFSQMHREWFVEPLVAVMNLGAGGDAITVSRRLFDAGVRSAATLGEYIAADPRQEILSLGHVFGCSMHHYLLRDWLAAGNIHPDTDVRLRVLPPNQMARQIQRGNVDGFCVGEPWNTLAESCGSGRIIAVTTDIVPNHPEKVLAVTRRWMSENQPLLVPLIRALLRACAICDNPNEHDALAGLLARPEYLHTPAEILRQSLSLDKHLAARDSRGVIRKSDWRVRSFSPSTTFPSKTHPAWLASQMLRWGHLPVTTDPLSLANSCADSSTYRQAARSLGLTCPADDFPPMPLRNGGMFHAEHVVAETETSNLVERV